MRFISILSERPHRVSSSELLSDSTEQSSSEACSHSASEYISRRFVAVVTRHCYRTLSGAKLIHSSDRFKEFVQGLVFRNIRAIFRDVTPYSTVEVNGNFEGMDCLHIQGPRVNKPARLTARPLRWRQSETSVNFRHSTQCHIPEDN
jgi:hypothetical protein